MGSRDHLTRVAAAPAIWVALCVLPAAAARADLFALTTHPQGSTVIAHYSDSGLFIETLPPEVLLSPRQAFCRHAGIGGIGTSSITSRHHGGIGRHGTARPQPDLSALLAGPVAACASRHGLTTWNVTMEIETTGREVVDVRLVNGADDPAFARCVVESGWALALGADHDRWTASFEVNVLGDSSRR